MIKRLLDIVMALCAAIVIGPVMAFVAIAIKLADNGPVLFRQQRVGRSCQEFAIFKFRTMVVNAEALGGYSTASDDPRITKIGKFLRKSSLDELPQILNVLRGDMSIVGPRPDVPAQKSEYTAEQWTMRHSVRPGITGPAQAMLRSSATPQERLKLDLEYVDNATVVNDAKIVARTVGQILFKGGI
jgi:lipopolysaccharide/colanic/teichoic acid biosynthesis glycosyltransferase